MPRLDLRRRRGTNLLATLVAFWRKDVKTALDLFVAHLKLVGYNIIVSLLALTIV
jgi:hypothetical protein